jgi:anaerobic magnesium-protoporphyrin IX monomethyl ester cyclase
LIFECFGKFMQKKNNRVLLINPSGWQKESTNLGLAYLSSALKEAGYPTLVLDINRYQLSDRVLTERVLYYSPRVIGISVKTATANSGGHIANLLSPVCPDVIFIAGGPHLTLCAESYMNDFSVFNYGIIGEGEKHLVELVDALSNNSAVNKLKGLVYRIDGRIQINRWHPPDDLNDLPLPDFDSIEGFEWEDFRYPILTSRGCPFQCIYCCVNKLTGSRKWRSRSASNVVDELEHIAQTKGIKSFEVLDDNFTLNIKRAKEICREIIDRKLNFSWYCHNGIRADRIDRELAMLMKQAGCTSVAFGIESGNPETFDSIKKGEPLSAIVTAVKLVKEAGIKAVGYFIIGLPGDTLQKFIETVQFQRSLKLDHYNYGMLIPYPKTEVWDMVKTRGKFLCNITSTQHFSNDLVPISFEMPAFPKKDMVRAFYISKFYDLFEIVQQIIDKGQIPTVVYLSTPDNIEFLPGMIIACDPNARHIINEYSDEKALFQLQSFSQVPDGINITFSRKIPHDLSKENTVVVCHNKSIPIGLIFRNTNMVLINPRLALHLVVRVRQHITNKWHIPEFPLSMVGYLSGIYNIAKRYSIKNICRAIIAEIKNLTASGR